MSTVKSQFSAFALVFVAAVVASTPVFACTEKDDKSHEKEYDKSDAKVTICHATNSQTNPYVTVTVSASSITGKHKILSGHGDHKGGVWYSGTADHSWGDIIPAFTNANGDKFAGQNMNEAGKKIFDNGCKVTVPTKNKHDEDKGKPVRAIENDDKKGEKKDKTHEVKTVSTAKTPADRGSVATELPHTGAAGIAGTVGILGASTYAVVRRFMK